MGFNGEEQIQNAARLQALKRTALLDSPPEEAFDRLTRLATKVLHVSASYVSLVDDDRQFFKSAVGLPEPWASRRQTPLTHSFCKHAVASGEPFIVSDARNNSLVKDNRAVSELGIIAYAGIPLTTVEGHTLGAFCVVDSQPREWKAEEVEVLRNLAPRRGSRCGWVTDNGRPLLTADLREGPQYLEHVWLLQDGILSALTVPLRAKDKVIGTLNVGSRQVGEYAEWDSELLLAIADQIVLAIQNMLAYEEITSLKSRLEQENLYLQEESRGEGAFADLVGESPAVRKVLASVRKVAGTDATVLVTGETGTGKEVVVRAIHALSGRKDKILVKVNCAALPSGVIESELFGHEKGAFTGAFTRRVGRFELANRGTLFLDEVGDLPLELQAKLLRVLQEGEFERLGGTQTLKVDVRMIAATNRDLKAAVEEGRFRADLFYRLNVFPIAIPPLRERLEDVPRLARHFVMIYASKMGKSIESVGEQTMSKLTAYGWPGNVRELQNVIERAVILSSKSRLELDDSLAAPVAAPRASSARTLEEIEREHILSVLESVGWRVSGERGASAILGLKRTTLEARMTKLGISRPS